MSSVRQKAFTGGELSDHAYARDDLAGYSNSAKKIENCIIHAHGGVSNRMGLEIVHEIEDAAKTRLIPFRFSRTQSYALAFSDQKMNIVKDGGIVLDNTLQIATLNTPYLEADLSHLKYAQSNDVMTICHGDYYPKDLARLDHDDWTLTDLVLQPEIDAPSSFSAARVNASGNNIYKYVVAAVSSITGEESLATAIEQINDGEHSMNESTSNYIQLSWDAVADADYYRIYRWDASNTPLWGLLGETEEITHKDQGLIIPDTSKSFQTANDPFASLNPDASPCYYAQRKTYAYNATLYFSQTGNFKNHNKARPIADDDAFEYTIAATESFQIEHLVPLGNDLVALTDLEEWLLSSGDKGVSISTLKATRKSRIGSSYIAPIIVKDDLLFVGVDQQSVHEFGSEFLDDNYEENDRTILATHLFEFNKIIDWGYAQYPHKIIWCVMDDGTLTSLTYMKEHQVWGWARHNTQGFFESVCVVKEGVEDVPYFVVKRIINGTTKRFIERMHTRKFKTIDDAFFVDCGLTYDGAPTNVISGLDHLNGENVVALADGKTVASTPVESGEITLPFAASKVHVGLPYKSRVETLDIMSDQVILDGRQKQVSEATIRYKNTRGVKIGTKDDNLRDLIQRSNNDGYGTIEARSGKSTVSVSAEWTDGGNIIIEQSEPLPMTILSVALEVDIA